MAVIRRGSRSWKINMADFLDVLGQKARKRVKEGYYKVTKQIIAPTKSLKEAVLECKNAPIISEIKVASPTMGVIRKKIDVNKVAIAMEKGGAIGISVLTEPKHFKGSIDTFIKVRSQVDLPLLMKDIVVNRTQIEAAAKMGANAILLIEALFKRGYCDCDVHRMIAEAHSQKLEVLLEILTEEEFISAIKTEADLIGINNRDLRTLEVDLEVTRRILTKNCINEKLIVSESGIKSSADVRFLHECGAHAFLVGSSIMRSSNIQKMVKELVLAL